MKKLLLLNVFLIAALNGMEEDIDDIKESVAWADQSIKDKTTTPAQVIRLYGGDPDVVRALLITYYDQDELGAWHDAEYNNLMHIAVGQFIDHQSATAADNAQYFQKCYKQLLGYLHQKGVQVNECNDHHQAPIFLLYNNTKDNAELIDYLEGKLGAHPTYFSLQPEVRAAKKYIKKLCCSCCGQEDEQHEKMD